jgi:hypothetical protein
MEMGIKRAADYNRMGSSLPRLHGSEGELGLKKRADQAIDQFGGDVGHVCKNDHDLVIVVFHRRQAGDNGRAEAFPEAMVFDDLEFGVAAIGLKAV